MYKRIPRVIAHPIRWPVRETNSPRRRPVTRENTSDTIFQSIGFHGPKPRAACVRGCT